MRLFGQKLDDFGVRVCNNLAALNVANLCGGYCPRLKCRSYCRYLALNDNRFPVA